MDFETLTLVNDALRIEVLPELGAKISSLWLPDLEEELLAGAAPALRGPQPHHGL